MKVQVAGLRCPKCHAMAVHAGIAVHNLGLDVPVEEVEDPRQIASLGVMDTPALVLDGKVVSSGKLLSSPEIEELLEDVAPV